MATELMQEEIVREWANIVVDRWRKRLRKLRIGVSDDLYDSFQLAIHQLSLGEVDRVDFSFLQYGRFRDMGVGKGTPLGMVKENAIALNRTRAAVGRRPGKWYTKTLRAETRTLSDLLADFYQLKGSELALNLTERINIEI